MDEGCIRYILQCTSEHASELVPPEWSLSEEEIEAFIGLLYLPAVVNQHNFLLDLLWSREMGSAAYSTTISHNRFHQISSSQSGFRGTQGFLNGLSGVPRKVISLS